MNNKISNFEQFENDCLDDKRVQKILTKMLNEENLLEGAFGNFDAIEKTIDMFDLDVNISENENGDKVIQYAMEDFCQLSKRLTYDKYRGSYEGCGRIIKKYSIYICKNSCNRVTL